MGGDPAPQARAGLSGDKRTSCQEVSRWEGYHTRVLTGRKSPVEAQLADSWVCREESAPSGIFLVIAFVFGEWRVCSRSQ